MIVRDKQATLEKANEIASILMKRLQKEVRTFECDDDPAEQIYLAIHTISNLIYRACFILQGYAQTYGIETLTIDIIYNWITEIAKEYFMQNAI